MRNVNMKIGIIFAGISFGYKRDRDFSHCFPNISRNLIEPLQLQHNVSTYVVTYDSDRIDEVIKLLNPKKIATIPYEGNSQNSVRAEAIKLVEGEDIDFYIMCRFDVHYNKSLEDFNIDWNKFNFTSPEPQEFWESERYVSDTFYAWPGRLHKGVVQGFRVLADVNTFAPFKVDPQEGRMNYRYLPEHMHNFFSILTPLIGLPNIHFMSNEPQVAGHLLLSTCHRVNVDYWLPRGNFINQEVIDRFKNTDKDTHE